MQSNILIEVEDSNLETRTKKGGGTYQVQVAFVHTVDRAGNPRRYPEQIALFPPRDNDGNPIPYKPGKYTLSAQSYRVNNGFLEMQFPQLVLVK